MFFVAQKNLNFGNNYIFCKWLKERNLMFNMHFICPQYSSILFAGQLRNYFAVKVKIFVNLQVFRRDEQNSCIMGFTKESWVETKYELKLSFYKEIMTYQSVNFLE